MFYWLKTKKVETLSSDAKEKAKELKIKQDTADKAMDQITDALEQASERRKEVQVKIFFFLLL